MMKSANGFPQRQNKDGSYDSICPGCFLTVGRGLTPRELSLKERSHACSQADLVFVNVAKDEIRSDINVHEEE